MKSGVAVKVHGIKSEVSEICGLGLKYVETGQRYAQVERYT